jgi:lipid-A-disaccharide synthase
MLVGRPMVAAYRVSSLTARIIRLFDMIKSKYYTLPNNLADEYLVPELIQEDITAQNVVDEIEKQYNQADSERKHMLNSFAKIHQQLRLNASEQAAKALYNLVEEGKGRSSTKVELNK